MLFSGTRSNISRKEGVYTGEKNSTKIKTLFTKGAFHDQGFLVESVCEHKTMDFAGISLRFG